MQQAFTNGGSQAAVAAAPPPTPNPYATATAAPSPGVTPPNEGLYGEYQANALKAYQDAQASIAAKRQGIYQSYGFNQDGSVNGNNMVGAYQQMKHSQALELQAAENSARERGLGGHGLGAQIAEAPRFQEDVDSAALGNAYLGALDSNSSDLGAASAAYQAALTDARNRQIQDDIANARYTVAADPGTTPPPPPNPASTVSNNAKTTAARLAAATKGKKPTAPVAVKVTANKTGASANKKQGIFSIH